MTSQPGTSQPSQRASIDPRGTDHLAVDALVEPADELTPEELRRYARHLLIGELGEVGQRRLKNARVLVIGAGGLGSPAVMYLAAAGVGTLGVVDFDVVEESNLQRQVIHGVGDVGCPKVESARRAIERINPLVTVRTHETELTAGNALELFADYDLVVDGSDNFATRYLANDACVLTGIPYVWASILRFEGQVSVFWAGHGPCYRCLFPEPPPPGAVPSCAEAGVLGVLCASIGSAQVTEAIKLITGIGEPLLGRLKLHDALSGNWRELGVRANPECALCGDEPTITELIDYELFCPAATAPSVERQDEITVAELAQRLRMREQGRDDFVLVDVREPRERAINQIPGSVLVPLGEFEAGTALAQLPEEAELLLYCRSGVRSAHALELVRAAGRDGLNVAGGVLDWVDSIDPSQATY